MTTYDFIASNKRRTTVIMVLFFALVLGVGWALDQYYEMGGGLLVFAGIYAVAMALVSYYSGDKVALRSSRAHPIEESDNPYVYRMVQNMCIATGTPMPKLYVINDSAINAFATGRDPEHASIAVTTGAIRKLENEELEGVLAHELAHVRNYDIRLMTVVIVLIGMLAIISDLVLRMHLFGGSRRDSKNGPLAVVGLILIIVSPLIAKLIQLAVSRRREFLADSTAVLTTRFPDGLARALARIDAENQPLQQSSRATAHLFIANPFRGNHWASLLSTHPPIADRLAALKKMGATLPAWAEE